MFTCKIYQFLFLSSRWENAALAAYLWVNREPRAHPWAPARRTALVTTKVPSRYLLGKAVRLIDPPWRPVSYLNKNLEKMFLIKITSIIMLWWPQVVAVHLAGQPQDLPPDLLADRVADPRRDKEASHPVDMVQRSRWMVRIKLTNSFYFILYIYYIFCFMAFFAPFE